MMFNVMINMLPTGKEALWVTKVGLLELFKMEDLLTNSTGQGVWPPPENLGPLLTAGMLIAYLAAL